MSALTNEYADLRTEVVCAIGAAIVECGLEAHVKRCFYGVSIVMRNRNLQAFSALVWFTVDAVYI